MRLNSHQLPAQLRQSLPPVIMVSGDEPLQKGEALDAVRLAARQQEFTEREIIDVGNPFDWSELAAVADNLSLFGDKRLIELRLSSAKIGNDGGKAIQHYIERPPEDTCLLITCPRLERAQNQSKWVKAIEQQGILVTVWPLEHKQLPGWLQQRMNALGLKAEPGAAQWLAERVEGNLLAAVQELEKLMLLQGPGPLSLEQMMASASDSARYTVFDLADAALAGEPARTVRIIRTLQAEGSPQPLVLWALSKEIRLLAEAATEARHGGQAAQLFSGRRDIPQRRQPLYAKAIQHQPPRGWLRLLVDCNQADRSIKGAPGMDPWLQLEQLALGLCGVRTGLARPPSNLN